MKNKSKNNLPKSEKKLFDLGTLLKNIYDISPGLICIANSNAGIFTECNPAVTSILGWSIKEFTSRPFMGYIHPDDRQKTVDTIAEQLKGKPVANFENRYRCKDGSYKWLAWQATAADKDGRVYAVATDITNSKQANEELRKSEARLSKAQAVANIGSWEMDITTEESVWSDQAYRLFGLEPKEFKMTFERFKDFLFPKDQETVLREVGEAMANKDSYEGEYRIVRRDNEVRFMHSIAKIEHDERGKPVLIHGTIQDITDRKNMEETLLKIEKRFQTAFENIFDCFGIYSSIRDKSGKIVDFNIDYVNKAACVANRMNKEEQIGKKLCEILPTHKETRLFEEFCQVVETGKPIIKESLFYKDVYKGEILTRAFDVNYSKLGDGFVAAWRDITKHKQAEEKLSGTLAQLRQLSFRLESIREEEAGRISRELHDEMGQYLTAINLNLQQLAKNLKKGDKKSIDELLKNTSEIVNETEEKVRELSLELRPLMLEELGLVPTFHWYIDKTFSHLEINCDFVSTNMNKRLSDNLKIAFFRVMQETITNVLRHAEATNVEINLKQTDKDVIYTIRDDGKGFDVQKYGITIKSSHGLGLVGIKERVQYLGGMVTIESEPKKGTTVMVIIPLKERTVYD